MVADALHDLRPDGQVWAIDWYDGNQCHRPEEVAHDRSNGRIFRITYNETAPVAVDLREKSDVELARLAVDSENEWYVRHARRLLQERAATDGMSVDCRDALQERLFPAPNGGAPLQAKSADPDRDARRLRALWALHVARDPWLRDPVTINRLLADPSPWIRAWSMQVLFEDLGKDGITAKRQQQLAVMAVGDPSPVVRLYLASLAGRLPWDQRWSIVEGLVTHAEDAADHNLPLLYWYAMEPLAEVDPQRALALAMTAGESIPLLRDFMIRRLGTGEPADALTLLIDGLADATDDASRITFLNAVHVVQRTHRDLEKPGAWDDVYASLTFESDSTGVKIRAHGISYLWGDETGRDEIIAFVFAKGDDRKLPESDRRTAFSFLVDAPYPDLVDFISYFVGEEQNLLGDALRGVATLDDEQIPATLIAYYGDLGPMHRRDALATLTSRVSFASELLAAVRDNRIPRQDLTADLVRQLRNLNDEELNNQIEQVWGVVRDTPEDRVRMIAEYRSLLESARHPEPDRQLGRAIFARTCQQCHTLFGTGGKVGPDITGSNRANLDYLLSNVIDPSAVMAKEYRPTVIATADGRVITGIVKEETEAALTIQTANELLTLPASDVDDRRESGKSMMPDDQLQPFSAHEVRSLFAYVSGVGQTPLLADDETATTLFNGQDLKGWVGNSELWSVEQDVIVGRSQGLDHNEFLVSELAFEDFHFNCQVMLVDNAGNSGIHFRSQPLSDGEVRGYQADIGPGWWGKLYEERGRGLLVDNDAEKFIKPGEWNEYTIVAVGSRVQTWINGDLCVDLDDPAGARRGVIALQLHSGGPMEVRYRGLQIVPLEPNPLGTTGQTFPSSIKGDVDREITWHRTQLDDKFRGEGVAVADFNSDSLLDIASGSVWFEQKEKAPSADELFSELRIRKRAISAWRRAFLPVPATWTMHPVLEQPAEFDINGYSESFMNWPEDLNGDGRLDLIVVDFPGKQTWWFENSGSPEQPWRRHEITPVTNNESPQYVDVDGDGRREIVFGAENGVMSLASPKSFPDAPWSLMPISYPGSPGTERFSHGLGIGDVNGDGRKDVLVTAGWWEQPVDPTEVAWTFHPAPFGQACSQMYVYDFDGDGDADVLSASAHDFGIWWHEQRPEVGDQRSEASASEEQSESTWTTHEIDTSYSETHAVCLADVDGDGLPDFVTGKRWWSHNGHGPGADGPAVLCWYRLRREDGKPVWKKHEIDAESGVGTQFTVADVNGDGLLDVVTSNKKGTFLFEQVRK